MKKTISNLRCINCENHALYTFECNINHPNYENKLTADLSGCFVKSKTHEQMDKVIELTDKLIKKIDKKSLL